MIDAINDLGADIWKSSQIIKEYDLKKSKFYTTTANLKGIINHDSDEYGARIYSPASKDIILQAYKGEYVYPEKTKIKKPIPKEIPRIEIKLKDGEYERLLEQYDKELVDRKMEEMEAWVNENPKKAYKKYYYALLNWCSREALAEIPIDYTIPSVNVVTTKVRGIDTLVFRDENTGITYIATEWSEA